MNLLCINILTMHIWLYNETVDSSTSLHKLMPANRTTMESTKPVPRYKQQECHVDHDNLTDYDVVADANDVVTSDGVYTHHDKLMSVVQELTNADHGSEETQLCDSYEYCLPTGPVGVCVVIIITVETINIIT